MFLNRNFSVKIQTNFRLRSWRANCIIIQLKLALIIWISRDNLLNNIDENKQSANIWVLDQIILHKIFCHLAGL